MCSNGLFARVPIAYRRAICLSNPSTFSISIITSFRTLELTLFSPRTQVPSPRPHAIKLSLPFSSASLGNAAMSQRFRHAIRPSERGRSNAALSHNLISAWRCQTVIEVLRHDAQETTISTVRAWQES